MTGRRSGEGAPTLPRRALHQHHPEAGDVVVLSRPLAQPPGRAAGLPRAVPATAADDSHPALLWSLGVLAWASRVIPRAVPVAAPLPDVAHDVVQPEGVGPVASHRRGRLQERSLVPAEVLPVEVALQGGYFLSQPEGG